MPAFPSERVLAVLVEVERGTEGDELVHAVGPLVDEHAHRVDVAQPRPRGERVGEVQVGGVGVVTGQHCGDAALGPPGGRLVELGLGQHADAHAEHVGCTHGR